MKFQCDRCKTRYSIADERVAGKILKIRCKNCSAVITVREGMKPRPATAAEAKGAVVGVAKKRAPTPMPQVVTPARGHKPRPRSNSALQGAFQDAMSQPAAVSPGDSVSDAPAALEEEWYVSISGDQSGPFSLNQARAWIAKQAHGADLHGWREGFDDWRSVDKINQLRSARKPAPPRRKKTAPPPIPSIPSRAPIPSMAAPRIERDADSEFDDDEHTVIDQNAGDIAAAMAAAATPVPPRPVTPAPARPATPAPARPVTPAPARPALAPVGLAAKPATPVPPSIPSLAKPGTPVPIGAPNADPNTPQPLFASAMDNLINEAEAAAAGHVPTNGQSSPGAPDGNMDLDIGEASRVVKLPLPPPATLRPLGAPGLPGVGAGAGAALGRGSGTHGSLPVVGMTGPQQALGMPQHQLAPITPQRKRRSLLIPLILASVAILGGGGALLFMSMNTEPEDTRVTRGQVGGNENIAVTRETPTSGASSKAIPPTDVVPEPTGTKQPKNQRRNPGRNPGTKVKKTVDDPFVEVAIGDPKKPSGPLQPDEVANKIRSKNLALKMCYERALKRDPLLEVPKSWMTVTIGSNGRVTSVVIPKLVGTGLGTCISQRVKSWKFRAGKGTFTGRFPLVFGR